MSNTSAPAAEDKLRVLVDACQALCRDAPADSASLFHDYGPAPNGMDEFVVREALADVAYASGEQDIAKHLRRALCSIGVEPAPGEDLPLTPSTESILAELGVVDDDGALHNVAGPEPTKPKRRKRRTAVLAKGMVSRRELAARIGVTTERIRQLVAQGQISEGPDGIDLAKALGEYQLNVDQAKVLADRHRVDRQRKKPPPAPVA